MTQPQQTPITMKLSRFASAARADCPFARAFDSDHDLSLTHFGLHDSDFWQIQWNFNVCWHYFTPQFRMVGDENVRWFISVSRPLDIGHPTRVPREPKLSNCCMLCLPASVEYGLHTSKSYPQLWPHSLLNLNVFPSPCS
jgi:hypothetical protein